MVPDWPLRGTVSLSTRRPCRTIVGERGLPVRTPAVHMSRPTVFARISPRGRFALRAERSSEVPAVKPGSSHKRRRTLRLLRVLPGGVFLPVGVVATASRVWRPVLGRNLARSFSPTLEPRSRRLGIRPGCRSRRPYGHWLGSAAPVERKCTGHGPTRFESRAARRMQLIALRR